MTEEEELETKDGDEGAVSEIEPETRMFDPDGDVVLVLWAEGMYRPK